MMFRCRLSRLLTCQRRRRRSTRRAPAGHRCEALEHRTVLSGLTVITHGFSPLGIEPAWTGGMADQIIDRFGGTRIDFDFETSGPSATLAETGETVVVYDWSDKSDNLAAGHAEPGWREAAGDVLANWLLGQNLAQNADHIHFIAHSFGTVVISEAIRRLGVYGIPVDQMTTLDPHDQDQAGIPDARDFPGNDPRDEPPVTVWSNVTFADNYWEDVVGSESDPTDNTDPATLLPVGRPVDGAANRNLSTEVDFNSGESFPSAPHTKIHEWYYRTINGQEEPGGYGEQTGDNWYPAPVTDPVGHGYALSAAAAGSRDTADLQTLQMTAADGCGNPIPTLDQTVFNGDFRFFEPDGGTGNLPGYDDGNNADVVATGDEHGYAYEIEFGDFSFTHRPVYFSEAAEFFSFDYNVRNAGGGDRLQVMVDGAADRLFDAEISGASPGWMRARIPIPESLRGTSAEFTVGLDDPGFGVVNSVVWIDNLLIEQPSVGTLTANAQTSSVLDPDGNNRADLFADGILIARFLAGFRGDALVDGAIGNGAACPDAADIEEFLISASTLLDVDGNGSTELFSDGILVARYLAGFRDTALVDGAIGTGAARTNPQVIAAYLDALLPAASEQPSAPALSSADISATTADIDRILEDQLQPLVSLLW